MCSPISWRDNKIICLFLHYNTSQIVRFYHSRVSNIIIFVADPNNIFAAHEGLPVANEISLGTERCCGDHSASQQGRRLVSPLHARREFGHRDIQRCDARIGEQTRLEASPWRTRSEGRASRSLIEVSLFPCSLSRGCPRWITCSLWHWHSETYWIPKRRISSRRVSPIAYVIYARQIYVRVSRRRIKRIYSH